MAKKDGRDEPGLVHVPGGKLARALGTGITPLVTRPLMFQGGVLVEPDKIVAIRLIDPSRTLSVYTKDVPMPETPEKFAAVLERAGTDRFAFVARVHGREVVSGEVFFNPVELLTFHPPRADDASGTALALRTALSRHQYGSTTFEIRPPRMTGNAYNDSDHFNLKHNRDWIGMVRTRGGESVRLMPEDRLFLPGRGLFSAADLLDVPGLARQEAPPLEVPTMKLHRINGAIPLGPSRTPRALE